MDPGDAPIVSVITPVYNGAKYLNECIQSVLDQTFTNWEYVILDNVSTDQTPVIAEKFAAQDKRIRFIRAAEFLDIYRNHNRALRSMDPKARYCKIVHADDWLYPLCLERMVAVADAYPSVGLVSAMRSANGHVEYRVPVRPTQNVRAGREVVRQELLGIGWATGSPSTLLIRGDIVRERPEFYDPTCWHADTDAAFRVLMSHDLGFVHEVLTHTRVHPEAQSSFSSRVGSNLSRDGRLLLRYGRQTLSPAEYRRRRSRFLTRYGVFLAAQRLRPSRRGDTDFYAHHRAEIDYTLAEAGHEPAMQMLLGVYRRWLVGGDAQPQLN